MSSVSGDGDEIPDGTVLVERMDGLSVEILGEGGQKFLCGCRCSRWVLGGDKGENCGGHGVSIGCVWPCSA